MFSIFSRKKPDTDEEYEKLLADLDGKIRRNERHLSELKAKERKSIADFIFYCAAIYVVYLGYYILAVYLPGDQSGYSEMTWIGLTLASMILPLIMWYFARVVRWLHRRRQSSALTELEGLRKSQKEAVEELKKRTKFDRTRSLIEKYGGQGQGGPRTPIAPGPEPQGTPVRAQAPPSSGRRQPPPFVSPIGRNEVASAPPTPGTPAVLPGSLVSPPPPMPQLNPNLRIAPPTLAPPTVLPAYDTPKAWYDKLFDALIGPAEGPNSKYALICSKCFAHNGLAVAEEFEDIQYYCLRCQHFNSRRKGRHDRPEQSDDEPRGRSRSAGSALDPSVPAGMTADSPSPVRSRERPSRAPDSEDPISGTGGDEPDGNEEDDEDETGSVVEMDVDEEPGASH